MVAIFQLAGWGQDNFAAVAVIKPCAFESKALKANVWLTHGEGLLADFCIDFAGSILFYDVKHDMYDNVWYS